MIPECKTQIGRRLVNVNRELEISVSRNIELLACYIPVQVIFSESYIGFCRRILMFRSLGCSYRGFILVVLVEYTVDHYYFAIYKTMYLEIKKLFKDLIIVQYI